MRAALAAGRRGLQGLRPVHGGTVQPGDTLRRSGGPLRGLDQVRRVRVGLGVGDLALRAFHRNRPAVPRLGRQLVEVHGFGCRSDADGRGPR